MSVSLERMRSRCDRVLGPLSQWPHQSVADGRTEAARGERADAPGAATATGVASGRLYEPSGMAKRSVGRLYVRNPNAASAQHAAHMRWLIGADGVDVRRRAVLELFVQMAHKDAFNQLRTVESLGYIVRLQVGQAVCPEFLSLTLGIQSTNHLPEHLVSRGLAWLEAFACRLTALPHATFERHRASLAAKFREPALTLDEQHSMLWTSIRDGHSMSDLKHQIATQVDSLQLGDMVAFCKQDLLRNCHCCIVYIHGNPQRS